MRLNDIADNPGAVKESKGRTGSGSGKGKTGGRGIKGQKSRSGVSIKAFEGGARCLFIKDFPSEGSIQGIQKKLNDQVNLGSIQD